MRKYLLVLPLLLAFSAAVFFLTANKASQSSVVACTPSDLTGFYEHDTKQAFFEGQSVDAPLFARDFDENTAVLGTSNPDQRWIEVDLSEQKLRAWDGNQLYFETPVSTGLPGTPTPTGEFRIWIKLRYTKMEGGSGRYYYYLPNVPYTMFFSNDKIPGWKGYGLHGTYWHNSFGTPRSHGCVNLPTPMAEKLYYWVTPVLPDGRSSVSATNSNPGTRIVIHE